MGVRQILLYSENETALRKKSFAVGILSRAEKRLIKNLKDTLKSHANGIGLAAPQINVHKRIVVVCLRGSDGSDLEPHRRGGTTRQPGGCQPGHAGEPGAYAAGVQVAGLDERGRSGQHRSRQGHRRLDAAGAAEPGVHLVRTGRMP